MPSILILCVGKLKEKYIINGAEDFIKRIKKYTNLSIIEIKDEKIGNKADCNFIKLNEGIRLKKTMPQGSYQVALDERGKLFSSIDFSKWLYDTLLFQGKDLTFIIGGALGLSSEIIKEANLVLSLSKMTFPHQIVRLLLLEQIYRGFTIINKEPYHK